VDERKCKQANQVAGGEDDEMGGIEEQDEDDV